MAFFPREAERFTWAILEGYGTRGGNNKGFALTEDILAPILLTCFSASQVYIAYSLGRRLKKLAKPFLRSQNLFSLFSILLSIGYVICTLLAITNLCLKLEFIATLQRGLLESRGLRGGSRPVVPEYCLEDVYYRYSTCWNQATTSLRDTTALIDKFIQGTFHILFLIANGLLVYRRSLFLSSPRLWWVSTIISSIPLLVSFAMFICYFALRGSLGFYFYFPMIYAPLVTGLMISPTLMVNLWREMREQGVLRVAATGRLAYGKAFRALLESGLLSFALGVFHPIPTLSSPCYSIVWISLGILAPQIIALRVAQAAIEQPSSQPSSHPLPQSSSQQQLRKPSTDGSSI